MSRSLSFDRVALFVNRLALLGLTAEQLENYLAEDDAVTLARLHAFAGPVTPPSAIEAAPSEPLWRPVEGNPNAIEVNLAADPKRPFPGAKIDWRWGQQTGWVLVEHKDNALCVGGRKVALHLEPEQASGGSLRGYKLFSRLEAKMAGVVLHPNIKSAMMENEHLFPENWKRDEAGNILNIYFWAVGFRYGQGSRCVGYVYFLLGAWHEDDGRLGHLWLVRGPAAIAS